MSKLFEGSLEATVSVQVKVRLGRVEFNDFGDVIHDRDTKELAETQVLDYLTDCFGDGVELERCDLDINMAPAEQARWDAYLQGLEEEYHQRWMRYYDTAEEMGIEHSRWSMGGGDNGEYYDLISDDQVMIDAYDLQMETKVDAVDLTYEVHWGGKPVTQEIEVREDGNLYYQDAHKTADDLINMSGDSHHYFIEGMTRRGIVTDTRGRVLVLELLTGS